MGFCCSIMAFSLELEEAFWYHQYWKKKKIHGLPLKTGPDKSVHKYVFTDFWCKGHES